MSVADGASPVSALSSLLATKLAYGPTERDMVLMHHSFGVELEDGRTETRTSSLIAFGEPGGDTSMAKTVGVTAAIGAQLVLDGLVSDTGVMLPTKANIYVPALRMLKEEGIDFEESVM